MTRKQIIRALTKRELQYLIDNPDILDDQSIEWWAKGGFNDYTNEQLEKSFSINAFQENKGKF